VALRRTIGAILRSGIHFERLVRGRWQYIRNWREQVMIEGQGVRCEWLWGTSIDYCRLVPGAGRRLLRAALREWPISLADAPERGSLPDVTFVIGHRGRSRLPLLKLTLASIAAQTDVCVECVVVEQSFVPEIRQELPPWVRYIHQPVVQEAPYGRAAAFNLGVRATSSPIFVFHDNDMLAPAGYAAEVVGRIRAGLEAVDLKRFTFYLTRESTEDVLRRNVLRGDEAVAEVVQNVHGGSLAISRGAYLAIGGFDESFVGWGGEDVEFWERVETLRSSRFGYLPFIHLWHEPQPEKTGATAAPAVGRYYELAGTPPRERIQRLLGTALRTSSGAARGDAE
jgi:hypothetical protein